MDITRISSVSGIDDNPGDGAILPLSGRFDQAVGAAYVDAGQRLEQIQAAGNNPDVANDPARLFQLQLDLQGYVKDMTLASSLVGHAVKTVETLLKS